MHLSDDQTVDWVAIAPPLALVVAALVALLGDAFVPRFRSGAGAVSLAGIAVALASTLSMRSEPRSAFCFAAAVSSCRPAARGSSTTSRSRGG